MKASWAASSASAALPVRRYAVRKAIPWCVRTIVSQARRSPRRARSTSSVSSSGRSTTAATTPGAWLGFRTMLARVARYEVGSDRIDDAVTAFGDAAREIETLDGFAGGWLLVDHEDGRTMTVTLWDNFAALENSER